MNSALIIKDTHPKIDFTSITQIGLKAYNLAAAHKADIDPCLPGTMDALSNDLDALSVVVPGAVQAHHEAQAATSTQNALLLQGRVRVRAIRKLVRKAGASKDVQRAYGVGQGTDWTLVRDVKAAIQQIIDRASSAPAEAAGFGILPSAVAALTKFLKSLADADTTQEEKRASAPLTTKERNLTANRILQSAVLIAGAGMVAFAEDPLTFASFEALMASTTKATAKSKVAKPKVDPLKAAEPKASPQPDAPHAP